MSRLMASFIPKGKYWCQGVSFDASPIESHIMLTLCITIQWPWRTAGPTIGLFIKLVMWSMTKSSVNVIAGTLQD